MKNKKKLKNKTKVSRKKYIIYKIIFFFLFVGIFFYAILFLFLFYLNVLVPLPDVKDYKTIPMPESSIIYDRDGLELYKIYSEKRTYVDYEEININMINAIVAGEDKRFWTHPGYDSIGIIRAIIYGLVSGNNFSGTSGITQQLAKVTYLSKERSIERKVKELYLSIELDSIFEKKDILELYLNKIFFGGNSYGIEQAALTFFGINASELGILESSILASLPKAPTGLSPYNRKDKLLGFPLIINIDNKIKNIEILSEVVLDNNKTEIDLLIKFINNLDIFIAGNNLKICGINKNDIKSFEFIISNNGCTFIKFKDLLSFLNSISIEYKNSHIEYKIGRKDYVLGRMLEDKYITFEQYKQSLIKSFGFEFKKYSDDIKYPHFVMYVRDNLVNKYGEKLIKEGGLKIYTTINSTLQEKAEKLIEKQVEINIEKFGARNAALISLDNKTGEILSMVGGVDYFDEGNLGYNNMIFARLQPGSTFKPFIYMLAMIKKGFTKDTIFTDAKFTFPGDYTPKNSDGKYLGKMTLSKALNYSRNIPAVKLYYAAGEEDEIIKFLEPFGLTSLLDFKEEFKEQYGYNYVYSAPMALGTVQITPFELAKAYSVFANSGIKNEIISILKIIDSNGKIIESINTLNEGIRVLDKEYSYNMNSILSNANDRPRNWNYFLTIPERQIAAKTGTSSKQYKKNVEDEEDIIAPKDLWTIGYTPQITTVVWAGNTSGEELTGKAYGLTGAGPIMRDFMNFAHQDLAVEKWTND
ncbi:MAG: transglycosylase domain-containing protein [Candidatus Gracilibacteria bacterium]